MKPMAAVACALSVTLGMAAVLVFRGKPEPRHRATGLDVPSAATPVDEPSHRRALPTTVARVEPRTPESNGRVGVDPQWAQKNREGIAALNARDLPRAVELFEACVAGAPDEPIFRENLAEALARTAADEWDRGGSAGQARAVEHLTRAVELAPTRKDVAARLAEMKKLLASESGNFTESSAHFELSYDGSRDDLSWKTTDLFDVLERAYLDFGELFVVDPIAAGRGKIRVVLYRREGFHGATGIGHWAGGLYDGSIRVPLEDLGREKASLSRVLRHELAHAFVHELGGRDVEAWLNEGLAQLLETADGADRDRNVATARRRLVEAEKSGVALVALDRLRDSLGNAGDDAAIARAYAESLAFVAYVAAEYGERVPYQLVAAHATKDGVAGEFRRRAGVSIESAFADFQAGLR